MSCITPLCDALTTTVLPRASQRTFNSLLFLVCLFLALPGEVRTQKKGRGAPTPSANISTLEEARRQGEAFWQARVTRCGGDYYSRIPNGNIIQYRGVSIRVVPSNLSEADSLNGYQFRGTVAFDYRLAREYSAQGKRWGQWRTFGSESLFYRNLITKRRGKWNIEEAGNYTTSSSKRPISCAELADPTESTRQYFEQRQQQAQGAELSEFLRTKNQRGFISSNFTDEMWRFVGAIGKSHLIDRASIFSKDQFIFARGEPRQITYKNLPDEVIKLIGEGYDASSLAFAPNGGWVIFKKQPARNYFSSIRGAMWSNVPEELGKSLQQCVDQHQNVEFLRFAPDGKAIIIIRDYNSGGKIWNYRTYLPEKHPLRVFLNGLKDFDVVNDIAFFPNGGFIAIYNGNGYSEHNAPSEVLKAVAELRSRPSRCPINVSVGFDGTWLAYFSCFRGGP